MSEDWKDAEGSQRQFGRAREDEERAAAWRRGEAAALGVDERHGSPGAASTGPGAAAVDRAFAAFAENVRDYAIFLMDPSGTITFWGEGARRIKGWTKAEAEGAHLRLLYPPGGSEDGTAEAHLAWAAEHGEYTGEGHRIRSNGGSFWGGVAITALRDGAGMLLGFAKLSRDLTAMRASEALRIATAEAAEAARLTAEAASAAKNGFLTTISHELRTPVNAILGYTELLEMELDGPLTAGQRRHLEGARASGRHLLTLITQVLDFSHVDGAASGDAATTPTEVAIAQVVANALALVATVADERDVELVDTVRDSRLGVAGLGDLVGVRQILANLLHNAVRFGASRDGRRSRITVRAGVATHGPRTAEAWRGGPWVYVCVEDTGPGIPADRLEAIFEPFVQADMRLTRQQGGLGLGLALSRRLARKMGGDLTAQSEVGVGSSFSLWLPAAPVDSSGGPGTSSGGRRPDVVERGMVDSGGDAEARRPGDPFRVVSDAVIGQLDRVLHAYVARLRTDSGTPSAHAIDEAQVEDHIAAFLGNLASSMHSLGDLASGAEHQGATPSELAEAHDGTQIQQVVAERHGAQRARLGWTEAEIRREYTILREEITGAVRRHAARSRPGPTTDGTRPDVTEALAALTRLLERAERMSLAGYRVALPAATTPGASGRPPDVRPGDPE